MAKTSGSERTTGGTPNRQPLLFPPDVAQIRRRALHHHFKRMAAMRDARNALFSRPLVGRDVFTRFYPWERGELSVERKRVWRCSYFDLLSAYARLTPPKAIGMMFDRASEEG